MRYNRGMKQHDVKPRYRIDLDLLLKITGWPIDYIFLLLRLPKEEQEILTLKNPK